MNKIEDENSRDPIIFDRLPSKVNTTVLQQLLDITHADLRGLIYNKHLNIRPYQATNTFYHFTHEMVRKIAFIVMFRDHPDFMEKGRRNYEILSDYVLNNFFLKDYRLEVDKFIEERIDLWLKSEESKLEPDKLNDDES